MGNGNHGYDMKLSLKQFCRFFRIFINADETVNVKIILNILEDCFFSCMQLPLYRHLVQLEL